MYQPPDWNQFQTQLSARLDLNDPNCEAALDQHSMVCSLAQETVAEQDLTFTFSPTGQVGEKLLKYFAEWIEQARLERELKDTDLRLALAKLELEEAVVRQQGQNLPPGTSLIPELFAVSPLSRKDLANRHIQRVLNAAIALANGQSPDFPQVQGLDLQRLRNDLQAVIDSNPEGGAELILKVCQNLDFAQAAVHDDEMNRCIRYLANLHTQFHDDDMIPHRFWMKSAAMAEHDNLHASQ